MNGSRRIRVLAVDDHPLIRSGIGALVAGEPDLELVGEAADGLEALQQFRTLRPQVTLMDLQMPVLGGVDAIKAIRAEFPDARIVVLTTYRGDVQAVRALKAGACGYVLKASLRKDLLDVVREVHAGRRRIPADIAQEIAQFAGDESLSPRELQVLSKVAEGSSNKDIGRALDISEDTVKAHMKGILSKLRARDRTHAVMLAIRRGILEF